MMWITRLMDFFTAISTLLVMWLAPKNPKWWLLYIISSVVFVALMLLKGVYFWAIVGTILIFVGIKNYAQS